MSPRDDAARADRADALEQIQLPLRGLASEGADEIVGRALCDMPGVAAVTVRVVEQVVRVRYDPAVTTGEAIRERMHSVGLVFPDRDAGAHGPESER